LPWEGGVSFNGEKRGGRGKGRGQVHEESSVENPNKSHYPSLGGVSSYGRPVEEEVEGEARAGYEGGEEEEDGCGEVVERLQREDLAEDFERGEFGEGAGARWAAAARHLEDVDLVLWWRWRLPGDHGRVSMFWLELRGGWYYWWIRSRVYRITRHRKRRSPFSSSSSPNL
jgi:hypothetical protein